MFVKGGRSAADVVGGGVPSRKGPPGLSGLGLRLCGMSFLGGSLAELQLHHVFLAERVRSAGLMQATDAGIDNVYQAVMGANMLPGSRWV